MPSPVERASSTICPARMSTVHRAQRQHSFSTVTSGSLLDQDEWRVCYWARLPGECEPVMTKPKPCPRAPGALEEYAARFDDLFTHVAQRRGFREYLAGLLAPRDRTKTLTALAGAEPVAGAGHP